MFEENESEQSRWRVFKMIKQHPVVSVLVVLLVLGGLFMVLRPTLATTTAATKTTTATPQIEEKKLPVEVAEVKNGSITSSITTTASLEPVRQVTMLSETTGVVEKLLVDEGSRVKEGQVLAVL